jgi:cytochrome d ubiquinol oxidase subunit II
MARWLSWPAVIYVAPVPLLTIFVAVRLVLAVNDRRDAVPFQSALLLFVLCYVGLGISLFPSIVPPSVSIWDAAGPDKSLGFLLVGAVVLVPIILAYTAYSYWVFRGKVVDGEGYH